MDGVAKIKVVKIHITPEFYSEMERLAAKEHFQVEPYVKRKVVEAMEPHVVGHMVWLRNGRRMNFTSRKTGKAVVEEVVLDVDEPTSFEKWDDTPTKYETKVLELHLPEIVLQRAMDAAMYENMVNRELNLRDPENERKVYGTVGEWFKAQILILAFPTDAEKKDHLEELKLVEPPSKTGVA
jgi:hypothetical protein